MTHCRQKVTLRFCLSLRMTCSFSKSWLFPSSSVWRMLPRICVVFLFHLSNWKIATNNYFCISSWCFDCQKEKVKNHALIVPESLAVFLPISGLKADEVYIYAHCKDLAGPIRLQMKPQPMSTYLKADLIRDTWPSRISLWEYSALSAIIRDDMSLMPVSLTMEP